MDIYDLRTHLQTAVELEWSTIPPYLCARWSLADGRNELAADCIEDVVTEEMLHLTLACNLLNAVGGEPHLVPPRGTPPRYPTFLPHSADSFVVNLLPFSPEALETFRRIERPARAGAPPEPDRFHTIGQFYEAILDAIVDLGEDIFTGPHELQVDSAYYYGGGGAFPVTNLEAAMQALEVIVFEGEGISHSIWDGDEELLGEREELAHYFRFDELYRGRRYVRGDTPSSGPTGEPIVLDFAAVLPMRPNPKAADHPPGSGLRAMADECNRTYSMLVRQLDAAFRGEAAQLVDAVQTMLQLRYQAVALMRVPIGDGMTAGPPFEWSG
jgi:Ferritin-like